MTLTVNQTTTGAHKSRVLFVITALGTGGAEMMLYKLLSRIDRNKYSPTVVSMLKGGVFVERLEALDIPVFDLGMQPGVLNPVALPKLMKLLRQIQPDVIQGWMYHANLIAQLANFFSGCNAPLFWSIHHSVDSLRAEKLTLAATIKLTAWLSSPVETVVFSAVKGLKQHLNLGYNSRNAIAISDNFDISKYKPASNADFNLRSTLNLPGDSILIGSVARYHPMKDHANLIDAAAKLVVNYPNVHFVLVGPNVDNQNPALSEQIKRLDIADQIHLLGERHDIPDIMTSLDIFTTSSAYGESFPNVLGEAMSCQTPCVATDIGDSKGIVADTGIVVPPRNPEALAQAWRELIDLGQDKRHQMGIEARQHIENNFNLDGANSFVKKYELLYQQALSN
ncbi:MAG: glycosyltransferase [Cyanobacteria bacterium P01_G01_bin.67]